MAQEEFENWVLNMVQTKPLPTAIQSIWFGLSRRGSVGSDATFVKIYMIGSHASPNEDKDWACYVDYAPNPEEELPDMEIYEDISDSVSKYMD